MPAEAVPAELLEAVRRAARGRGVLLAADAPPEPAPDWIGAVADPRALLSGPAAAPRADCALVVAPWLAPELLEAVVARLRDLSAREVYALVAGADAPGLRALGLRRLRVADAGGRAFSLHHYSIRSYKRTPAWLNPRHWAHPERWNRFRW